MPVVRRSSTLSAGQSLTEFALIFPVVMLLLVGIADLARWYSSALAIESGAREAADYGAFQSTNWSTTPVDNASITVDGMWLRACTAASTLPDYAGDAPGTPAMRCSNPSLDYDINPADPACSNSNTEPPCDLTVTLTYTFNLILGIPPMPESITFDRSSTFALSNIGAP